MPCYDGRENERQVTVTYEHEGRLRKEWMHNSPIAELLCTAMSNLQGVQRDALIRKDPKLGHWWNDHQERDRKKAASEKDKADKDKVRKEIRRLQGLL